MDYWNSGSRNHGSDYRDIAPKRISILTAHHTVHDASSLEKGVYYTRTGAVKSVNYFLGLKNVC